MQREIEEATECRKESRNEQNERNEIVKMEKR